MKVVFATEGSRGLQETIAHHFGRCPTYTIVDVVEDGEPEVQVVENPTLANHGPGMAPQYIASLGARYMVAGGMGPRAIEFFKSFGIQPLTGISGTVQEGLGVLLETLASNKKVPEPAPCEEHQGE